MRSAGAAHPDATANFLPHGWVIMKLTGAYPIVYYVNLFYTFFIPAVLRGMVSSSSPIFTAPHHPSRERLKHA
ncbi:MAG: hypothetical protein IPJ47_22865 [Anaerolineales bacterium]|nr:hypothetical protein [Anaerolineales bacterium]